MIRLDQIDRDKMHMPYRVHAAVGAKHQSLLPPATTVAATTLPRHRAGPLN